MSRRVDWSEAARQDAAPIAAFIAADSPAAAAKVTTRIDAAAISLGTRPIGRPGRVSGTYRKSLPRLPCILVYHVTEQAVVVLRIIHSARDWRPGAWPT